MKSYIFLLVFLISITPVFVSASECANGATVIYINGVFTKPVSAQEDRNKLRDAFFNLTKDKDTQFINGYNESHLSGIDDLVKSTIQSYQGGAVDYDLENILTQLHQDLKTRKILLVGHSQGTFYTNAAYEYLIKNGIPKESVAVYNIATPANAVAGEGIYLTSTTDKVINSIVRGLDSVSFAKKPLPANITIALAPEEEKDPLGGHGLSSTYLAGVPDRIIGDIKKALDNLSINPSSPSGQDGCFIVPTLTSWHDFKKSFFTEAENSANYITGPPQIVHDASNIIMNFTYHNIVLKIAGVSAGMISGVSQIVSNSKLWGASLSTIPLSSQVDQIPQHNPIEETNNENRDSNELLKDDNEDRLELQVMYIDAKQDAIDDLLEKIDLLRRQLTDLFKKEVVVAIAKEKDDTKNETELVVEEEGETTGNPPAVYVRSGGTSKSYPKIVISEVQIGGISNAKDEFVELYNPNTAEVDLSDWYLQRKTKGGSSYATFAPNTLFSGKKIAPKGYFLIVRQGSSFVGLGDIGIDNPLTEDNSLALKNPNGEVVDKIGWGEAQDFETAPTQNPAAGKSMGRRLLSEDEKDTDNNTEDFELNTPSPKAKNMSYTDPLPPTPKNTSEVLFTLSPLQSTSSFVLHFNIKNSPAITGNNSYIFRWKEENSDWNQDSYKEYDGSILTFSDTREFTGNDEKNYYFQLQVKDANGNESDWLPETPATTKISLPKKILINEIQIDSVLGTGGTNDDWVELYNPNNVTMSLSDWSIQKNSSDDPCSLNKSFFKKNFDKNVVIPANGYYLITSTNANSDLKNAANMTASWSLTDNNTIYLVRSQDKIIDGQDSDIVDKVGFGIKSCFAESTPAVAPIEGKSIERKRLGLDTDNNAEDFRGSEELTPGGTFPKVTMVDTTDYGQQLMSSSYSYPLLISWKSAASNIDFYEVEYKLNEGKWVDWLPHTDKPQEHFNGVYSLLKDTIYTFRARAHDKEGNIGEWALLTVDLTNPIVINEVAFKGTNADEKDQWIELYNKSDKDIDLSGWKIITGSTFTPYAVTLEGIIRANGYFILEKNDDNTLSDIVANQIFADPLDAQYIFLRDKNNRYIDEFSRGSEVVKGENHYSLERISPFSFGFSGKNWKINNENIINGHDRRGNLLLGTPGAQNSEYQRYTFYEGILNQDVILIKALSPYLFNGMVKIASGVTVTIEPGVVIKFNDAQSGIENHGTISAMGSTNEKIVFTSFLDDASSGDSNADENNSTPAPGDWLSIYFAPESNNSQLENVEVRYGGAVIRGDSLKFGNALWADQTSIILKDAIIENNKNRGLLLTNSNALIDSVSFLHQHAADFTSDEAKAITILGGAPEIKNSSFENNAIGIFVDAFLDQHTNTTIEANPVLESNTFVNNGQDTVFVAAAASPLSIEAVDDQQEAIIAEPEISQSDRAKADILSTMVNDNQQQIPPKEDMDLG